MKGQKNHLISCDAITTSNDNNTKNGISVKQKKQISHFIDQYKLDEDKEGRLGKLCNTAQWIIKIAQNRGAMSCLMIKNIEFTGRKDGSWTLLVHTSDNQKLNLVFPGKWFDEAKEYFRPLQNNPFIISGAGAIIHPSSDKLIFPSGSCCLYMLDISQFKTEPKHSIWHGWLEVSEGVVVEEPSLCKPSGSAEDREAMDEYMQNEPVSTPPNTRQVLAPVNLTQQTSLPTPPEDIEEPKRMSYNERPRVNVSHTSTKELVPSHPVKEEYVSSNAHRKEPFSSNLSAKRKLIEEDEQSSNRNQKLRSLASSVEPDWLDTPAPVRIDRRSSTIMPLEMTTSTLSYNKNTPNPNTPLAHSIKSTPSHNQSSSNIHEKPTASNQSNSASNNSRGGKTMSKRAIAEAQEQRVVGGHLITPICQVITTFKKQNTFGLVTSNEQIFRAGGGTGDFKLTVYVEDVFPLQSNKLSMTFNLFEQNQDYLPICSAGDMLAILNFATKEFNGAIQGTGYRGTGWIVLSAETGKFQFSKNLEHAKPMMLCDEMRTHFDRMYKSIGTPAPMQNRRRRQIRLEDVEPTVFFDAQVQIVDIWDGLQPCIYVTDYTAHTSLPMAQDVRLKVYSQEDLKQQMEQKGNEGGGRVMPIYVWEDYREVLSEIKAGDYLSLRNVRPKMNPGNFLEGNMGDRDISSNPNKINIYQIHDEDIIKAIEERREAYQEEAAISQAESNFQQSSAPSSSISTNTSN